MEVLPVVSHKILSGKSVSIFEYAHVVRCHCECDVAQKSGLKILLVSRSQSFHRDCKAYIKGHASNVPK